MKTKLGINWTVWVAGYEFYNWCICLHFGPIHLYLGGK